MVWGEKVLTKALGIEDSLNARGFEAPKSAKFIPTGPETKKLHFERSKNGSRKHEVCGLREQPIMNEYGQTGTSARKVFIPVNRTKKATATRECKKAEPPPAANI